MDRRFIQKVRRRDRIATRIITIGGMMIIACVIAILLLIFRVALPLFKPASADLAHQFPVTADPTATALAVGVDDYQENGFILDSRGDFSFFRLADGSPGKRVSLAPASGPRVVAIDSYMNSVFTLHWQDQSTTVCQVGYRLEFDDAGQRSVLPEVTPLKNIAGGSYPAPPLKVAARLSGEGRFTSVALLPGNRFAVQHETTTTDLFDNQTTETSAFLIDEELPGKITVFTLDEQGNTLYAGTDTGSLLRWNLAADNAAQRTDNVVAVAGNQAITALAMIFGDISVAVGGADGSLATWMMVPIDSADSHAKKLRQIHRLKRHKGAITAIAPSRRTKSLASQSAKGEIHLDHMTSENHLLTINAELTAFGIAGRDNALIGLNRRGELLLWELDNPHPEINPRTLFGKVWYESYPQPEYVWQSSAANDDFEPKFSVVPLLFGTIKGTLYAMIFAIPLAIFGAVYTSQLTSHRFKKTIKPAIEIMASVPSVVIGFLIALWLAPIVEDHVLALLVGLILVPVVFVSFVMLIRPLCQTPTMQHRMKGYEFLILLPVIVLTGVAAVLIAPLLESLLFAGNFTQWLYTSLDMRYDQRNCIIIAFGLGIAVIPIIFSITEDAISNIPPSLTAASLALGASRWQTIWRVVLPSASPGIFAAIMIGFGRAVGETMIVLMATGNTPIMDWSLFNGMRTLSANIAVEIPEAPVGGTLYRVLFLCATLLFMMTFLLNTGAEIIRERLRKKYGRY